MGRAEIGLFRGGLEGPCDARLLARGSVLRNEVALGGLVDRLVGSGEGRGGRRLHVSLGGGLERVGAAQVEDALLERSAVGLLSGTGDCHVAPPYDTGSGYANSRELRAGTQLPSMGNGLLLKEGTWISP